MGLFKIGALSIRLAMDLPDHRRRFRGATTATGNTGWPDHMLVRPGTDVLRDTRVTLGLENGHPIITVL
jgi:hypothetical protein